TKGNKTYVWRVPVMQLRKVAEAAYLTADNHSRYRMILRYFFIQHERMRDFIFPEEVYQYIKEKEGFETYEEDSLHQDLNQLVTWGICFLDKKRAVKKQLKSIRKKDFAINQPLIPLNSSGCSQ